MELSDFRTYHYPDGHKHIVSDKDLHGDDTLSVAIKSFDDLFLAAQVLDIHSEIRNLRIKYMLAARCDRRFSPGEAMDLRIVCDFICHLVSTYHLESVTVVKPHSPKTLERLKALGIANAYEEDPTGMLLDLVRQEVSKPCFVIPDEGARQWVYKKVTRDDYTIQGSKKRHPDFSISIEFSPDLLEAAVRKYKNFVIVDDLCDGGGTFISIAKTIKAASPQAKIYLVVTHVILSKGFQPFEGWIDRIYCTNSFADFENPLVKQIKI